ncbi:hypothetical protein IHE44_0010667 [Lamprotornis superbus]|uniref:Cilia- and flagella-associated protein 45 n=1 Tax=Lamprotornis superbus TaxID=245042 RepID=A0A835NK62_9PASS|nr:hypothetical protein IHE44_0010667 [Lamprotornis superbus]
MIRDKQVLEKRMIHKELAEEEKRLDKMLEMEREKGMEVQEELERRRKRELIRARQDIVKQMEQNAEERVLRAEELYQEGQRQLESLEQMKREDQKVGAGNRRVQGGFHLAGKGLAVLDQPHSGSGHSSQQDQSSAPMGTWWHPREVTQSLPALREEEEEEEEGALGLVASNPAWHFQAWEQKQEQKRKIFAEIQHFNMESQRLKDQQRERERLEDERVLEHQRQKALSHRAHQEQLEQEKLQQEQRELRQRAHGEDLRRQIQELRQQRHRERAAVMEEGRQREQEIQQRSQRLAQLRQQKLQEFRSGAASAASLGSLGPSWCPPPSSLCILSKRDLLQGLGARSIGSLMDSFLCRATGIPDKYCAQVERRVRSQASTAPS